ncbi:MAG: hypothetical protein KBT03_03730, partial [Bacteroidales bacterium]|nr:hypothetical protein [Candidatus Scybalousia scybalohippi]
MARQILGKVIITNRDEYIAGRTYEMLDVVSYNGSSYISKKNDNVAVPTNKDFWQLLAKKGDTYEVSQEDLNKIKKEIVDDANSDFNENVRQKTQAFEELNTRATNTFSANAEEKTGSFNENANSKYASYNQNASNKTSEYNTNATQKLDAYNTNDSAKLKAYNDNATQKTDVFNNNASNLTTGFNNSANQKIKEYNDNAEEKVIGLEQRTSELNEMLEEEGSTQLDLIKNEGASYNRRITANSNEIYKIKEDILENGEAEGSIIRVEDSTWADARGLVIDGELKQETTTGKNLLGIKSAEIYTYSSATPVSTT